MLTEQEKARYVYITRLQERIDQVKIGEEIWVMPRINICYFMEDNGFVPGSQCNYWRREREV